MRAISVYQSIKASAAHAAVTVGMALLRVTPDRLLMGVGERALQRIVYPDGRDFLKTALLLAKRDLKDKSPAVRRSILGTLAKLLAGHDSKRKAFKAQTGFHAPILLVISPTMRCNLNCYGCYAGKYDRRNDLGMETLERLLTEAEDMGVYFMVISGGEPFILGGELLEIIERHPSILFQVYTNGTLIDKETARSIARVGNIVPCISVEGFEEETDARRGKGTFEKVIHAMDCLRSEGVIFGFSATATKDNNELIVSDEFVDFYKNKGCLVGWYFHYVPVGKEPGIELMPTPEQRMIRRNALVRRRERHDILLADFWNDGPLVGGCLAGGRYLHVTTSGDVEPCVFVHFAVDNVKEKSLRHILESPFFSEIRRRQPYDDNLFRPCMIIDLPEVLREVVSVCGAHPTHNGAEAVINDWAEDLNEYSESYRGLADAKWREYQRL